MNTQFESSIRGYMILRNIKNLESIREHTSIRSNTTFLKKWKYPETFTAEELWDMFNYLNIPYEERLKIMGHLWGKQWSITISS